MPSPKTILSAKSLRGIETGPSLAVPPHAWSNPIVSHRHVPCIGPPAHAFTCGMPTIADLHNAANLNPSFNLRWHASCPRPEAGVSLALTYRYAATRYALDLAAHAFTYARDHWARLARKGEVLGASGIMFPRWCECVSECVSV